MTGNVVERTQLAVTSETETRWLRLNWFALLLGGVIAACFPRVVTGLGTFCARDFGIFSCPVAYYQRECFWHAELPFWNPYNNCGTPFLAQWNTMCLYPPALFYLLLSFPWSLNCFCLFHLWFGGLGMYRLAHGWTANRFGAAAAGLVFAFNGLSLNFLMWPSHIATFSWMPWVILAVERGRQEGGRSLILSALAGAMQLLAGGPETILFTWLLVLGLWAVESAGTAAKPVGRALLRSGWRVACAAALAFALAAAQMLPFLDLAAHSQREVGFAEAAWSMPGSGWANFLVPMVFGKLFPEGYFLQTGQQWTSSYYVGIGTVLLALVAVFSVRDRRVWLMIGAMGVALVCALGDHTFIYPALQRAIPQLTMMNFPVKFVIVIVFAAPLLAAFAIAWATDMGRQKSGTPIRRETILGGVLLGLIGLILIWAHNQPTPGTTFSVALNNSISRAGILVAIIAALYLLQRANSKRWRNVGSLALLSLLWLDLWTHEPPQNPTVSPSVFTPGQALVELGLQPQPRLGESRVMISRDAKKDFHFLAVQDLETELIAKRIGFAYDCNLLDDVPKVDGFFSLYPGNIEFLFAAIYFLTNVESRPLEDFLSVSHVTAPGKLTEWVTRTTWLPMVSGGQSPLFMDTAAAARRLLQPDFDGRRMVLLPNEAQTLVQSIKPTDVRVDSLRFGRQEVDFDVSAAAPSLAVVSQSYYHWWQPYVDGQPVPLLQANFAFQALPVPGGRHHVRLVYEDQMFRVGASISIATLLGLGFAWWRLREKGAIEKAANLKSKPVNTPN